MDSYIVKYRDSVFPFNTKACHRKGKILSQHSVTICNTVLVMCLFWVSKNILWVCISPHHIVNIIVTAILTVTEISRV